MFLFYGQEEKVSAGNQDNAWMSKLNIDTDIIAEILV